MKFEIESDHKPLIPLFSDKQLDNLPPRILQFRFRMAKFHYIITHVPGKPLYTADTLSRSPMATSTNDTLKFEEVEKFIAVIVNSLPASNRRLSIYSSAQESDPTCCQVKQFCKDGWPAKHQLDPEV